MNPAEHKIETFTFSQPTPNIINKLGRIGAVFALAGTMSGLGGQVAEADDYPLSSVPEQVPLQPGELLEVSVAGVYGIPADAEQAYVNLTVTNAEGPGFLSVVDCRNPQPDTSIINYDGLSNSTRANMALVTLQNGKFCLMSNQFPTNVLVDVSAVDRGESMLFETPDKPIRIDDSRTEDLVQADTERTVQVAGVNGVPASARTVLVNLTATQPQAPGYVSAKDCDGVPAETSSVNFPQANMNGSTTILVNLDENGRFCVGTYQGDVHVIADVMAWITDIDSPLKMLKTPSRLDDSRPDEMVPVFGKRVVQIAGKKGVPADAGIVFANVTGVSELSTYMSVGDCDKTSLPNSSILNLNGEAKISDAKANGAVIDLSESGDFCIYGGNGPVGTGALHGLVDVAGYIRNGAEPVGLRAFQDPIRVEDTRDRHISAMPPPDAQLGSTSFQLVESIGDYIQPGDLDLSCSYNNELNQQLTDIKIKNIDRFQPSEDLYLLLTFQAVGSLKQTFLSSPVRNIDGTYENTVQTSKEFIIPELAVFRGALTVNIVREKISEDWIITPENYAYALYNIVINCTET